MKLKLNANLQPEPQVSGWLRFFKDTTRNEAAANSLSDKNIETTMYRARREIEPTIPRSAAEFCQQIQSTQYAVCYRGEVTVCS